jgi:hypothetical protein
MSELFTGNTLSTICLITSFILFVLSIKLKTVKAENTNNKSKSHSMSQDIEIKKKG